jgi:hypothetical protein
MAGKRGQPRKLKSTRCEEDQALPKPIKENIARPMLNIIDASSRTMVESGKPLDK